MKVLLFSKIDYVRKLYWHHEVKTVNKTKLKEVKCVVWDLDNTLWDGILSEGDELKLKPGVKEIIKTLDSRGILNSISSKNNYEDTKIKLEEFGLFEYFLYPQINWNAKSSSIKKISEDLNIGLDTFIFLDDQPFELDEVKNELEDVQCINSIEYQDILNYPRLNPRFITEDSKKRRFLYLEEMNRKHDEDSFVGPPEKFLKSLNMKFCITEAEEEDLKRAEELTVRSNQLNATGVTYSYEELNSFRQSSEYKLYICELVDNYGSYGKIGLALVDIRDEWHLKLLLMSCRVMSRGLGSVLLTFIMNQAKEKSSKLFADFRSTDRNKQMYIGYRFSNFKEAESDNEGRILFVNNLDKIPNYPPYIEISY